MGLSRQDPAQKTPEAIEVDEKDRAIIDALRVDARIPATELEPLVDLTAGAVRRRLERLGSAGVFEGMKINERLIGDAAVEAYATLDFLDVDRGKALLQDALEEGTINSAALLLGDPDALVHLQGSSVEEVDGKLRGLRIKDVVGSTNLLIVADPFNTVPKS